MNRTITGCLLLMLFGPVTTSVAQNGEYRPLRMLTPLPSPELSASGGRAFPETGQTTPVPVSVSLREAIDRGLRNDVVALVGAQDIRVAEGERWKAMKDLLPNVSAHVLQARELLNTAAFGFDLGVIGPYSIFDARVSVIQPLFDLQAAHKVRAETATIDARRHSYENVREFVTVAITNLYLQTVAATNTLREAQGRFGAVEIGRVAARKDGEATARQRAQQDQILLLENAMKKRKLALARAIGVPPGQDFTLTDQISYSPIHFTSIDEAVDRAYLQRADYQEALDRVRAAESRVKSTSSARLPSVVVQGDYGDIGPSASTAVKTFGLRTHVRLSIFDAERHGKIVQAHAELEQARARLNDLRTGVYYDVQAALLDVQTADVQVRVSRGAVEAAEARLAQSDASRINRGISVTPTAGIQLVTTADADADDDQAHDAILGARTNYTSALYGYNAAKLNLMRALGGVEKTIGELFAGGR